jgi:TatA/E family protein of Tat protein translocase
MVGAQDLLIGLVLAAFLFGAQRLPEIARSLGQALGEFRKSMAGEPGTDGAAPAGGGRTCETCRAPIEPGWAHCARCGSRIDDGATPAGPRDSS